MDRSAPAPAPTMSTHVMMVNEIRDPRTNFVVDIAPLEIIDKEDDEDFINSVVVEDINQIDLVIHIINHDIIYQYWSLKSGDDSINSTSSCHHQHHRDDDDNDEEMIMIISQPIHPPNVTVDKLLVDQGVFAHQDVDDDDYIMSLLHDMDTLYEYEKLSYYEDLVEMKKCITQRISEAKPALLMSKPKRVRIRVHLSRIHKRYYANSADANTAAAFQFYAEPRRPPRPKLLIPYEMMMKPASRLSKEALETRILQKEDLDLISSTSCSVCLIEFDVGVDVIKKMPCSHVFHHTCLLDWLVQRNTCPLCRYELPTRQLPSSRWNCLPTRHLPTSLQHRRFPITYRFSTRHLGRLQHSRFPITLRFRHSRTRLQHRFQDT